VDSLIRVARLQRTVAPTPGNDASKDDSGIELASMKRNDQSPQNDRGLEMTELRHSSAPSSSPVAPSPVAAAVFATSSPNVAAAGDRSSPGSSKGSSPVKTAGRSPLVSESTQSPDNGAPKAPLLSVDDQRSILDILHNAGALSEMQYKALCRLLLVGDRRISAHFQQYEADKDVQALIAGLKAAASMLASVGGDSEEEDEDDDNEVKIILLYVRKLLM
jgi:hypothetical protein